MSRKYAPLRWSPLKSIAGVAVARVVQPPRVTLDSPALSVMTDFSLTPAATIESETGTFAQPFAQIEAALGHWRA